MLLTNQGVSLNSCDADAAGLVAGAAVVTPLLLSAPLCNSSANVFDPFLLLLAELFWSILFSLCNDLGGLTPSCCLATVHPTVAPSSPMSCLVVVGILLDSCSLKWQWRNWDRVHSKFWSVHCPSAVCHSPKCSNTLLTASLSHLL